DRFAQRYKAAQEQLQTWKQAKREAEHNSDQAGVQKAEHAIKEAGEAIDELDLFRKNLQSFVRSYEFLSQIISFDDPELEQLCVFAKHLHPLLRVDRLEQDEIDLSELALTHYRLTKHQEQRLPLEVQEDNADYSLRPVSEVGSGKPHDPDKKPLAEIIDRLNDLFGAEVSDEDKLHFAQGVADRIERDETVMAEVNRNSPQQLMHGQFPQRVADIVLDAMNDNEKMSMEILDNKEKGKDFAMLILQLIAGRQDGSVSAGAGQR
ncbi:MAG: type I restriction endonuclease subunit R, partial [Spiribacter salinus]